MIRQAISALSSLVVPPSCLSCGEPDFSGHVLCCSCISELPLIHGSRCSRCGAPSTTSVESCLHCRGLSDFDGCSWAAASYDGPSRALVAALKRRRSRDAATLMAKLIAGNAPGWLLSGVVVPVPASPGRLYRHGFNQSELLADALSDESGLDSARLIEHCGSAHRQVGLVRSSRLSNASNSYRAHHRGRPPGRVLLVDDVFTTGATISACAKALKRSGVGSVNSVTFARTLLKPSLCST